ncbi:hypothetical protein RSK20926_05902 [Roseobacter sp. SK209-2-6]|uniref:universal stress protein n=1 Tax=Roseobacter sp. SK209-2-6 TaxID=388739 RepID=UPI0000F3D81B|nr:universal stress protein [Roseobacter sp. SK209-2-6]EBA17245.1 hypothetical protein RSK20926_05902 [Roseobacter sp. SK209-2-6]
MFKHIMIPVDLRLPDPVPKALKLAIKFARTDGARLTLVNVYGEQASDAPGGKAAEEMVAVLAREIGAGLGNPVDGIAIYSVDIAAEVDSILAKTAEEIEADLVVVGSHAPRLLDYIFSSHGGYLVRHSKASVFVVR